MEDKISDDKIEEFVDEILKDCDINISLIPDVVEKKIYTNVTKIVLHLLKKTIETTSIKFLNHEVKLSLNPES